MKMVISIFLSLLLLSTSASASQRTLQAAELQRIRSIISFLETKLSSEDAFEGSDPSLKLNALLSSLELFGLSLPPDTELPKDPNPTELAIALLGSKPPDYRRVAIANICDFLQQFPDYKEGNKERERGKAIPRGRAIKSLASSTEAIEPREVNAPERLEALLYTPERDLRKRIRREVEKQRSLEAKKETEKAAEKELESNDDPSHPKTSEKVEKIKALLSDIRSQVEGSSSSEALEQLSQKPNLPLKDYQDPRGREWLIGPKP